MLLMLAIRATIASRLGLDDRMEAMRKLALRALSGIFWVALVAFVVVDYFAGSALELGSGSGRHAIEVCIAALLYCGATFFAGKADE